MLNIIPSPSVKMWIFYNSNKEHWSCGHNNNEISHELSKCDTDIIIEQMPPENGANRLVWYGVAIKLYFVKNAKICEAQWNKEQ